MNIGQAHVCCCVVLSLSVQDLPASADRGERGDQHGSFPPVFLAGWGLLADPAVHLHGQPVKELERILLSLARGKRFKPTPK